MSASKITVLKLRQLKPCEATLSTVGRLPVGCNEDTLQFNISIPTELWKVIVDRQAAAVANGVRSYNSLTLLPVRDIRDLSVSNGVLGLLSRHSPVGLCIRNAVLVNPVSEEFRSYGFTISYLAVSFDGPDDFNIGVVLGGGLTSGTGRVIFAANHLLHLLKRPSGALVSCTINV